MNIQHASRSRAATPEEVAQDGLAMSNIKQMFPNGEMIGKMSPHNACESIPGWTPYLDESAAICLTQKAADTFREVADTLRAIADAGPTRATLRDISAAFFRIAQVSADLDGESRRQATQP